MPSTPTYGLRYPASSAVPDVPTDMGNLAGDVEKGLLNPAVRVYHNAAQSIASGAAQALAFNSERFDQAQGAAATQHDPATNNSRLTCVQDGVYLITGNVSWAANTTGYRQVGIRLNGTTYLASVFEYPSQTATTDQVVTTLYKLIAGDYVELMAINGSSVALNVNSTGNYTPEFGMARVA